ncbi:MAG: ABC transporter permease [Actinobacteria bacterium]|nr:ABC transporter permease [Actinomycetota bacterium]MCL5446131.1 ABC transporter permease [Actinomycetota bacterium]
MNWHHGVSSAGRVLVALVIALVLVSIAFQTGGYSATGTWSAVLTGAVTGPGSLEATLRYALPLAFIAIGVTVSFRGGFFNAGAQGQFYAGGIVSLYLALVLPASMGGTLVAFVALIAGAFAGALWSIIPGILRIFFNVDEVIGTLMFSFIAIYLVTYVSTGPLKSPTAGGQVAVTRSVPAAVRVTPSSGLSVEMVVAVLLVGIVVWWLLHRTRFGFEIGLVGRNPIMAEVQGVEIRRIGLATFAVTGFTAGLAGAVEVLGPVGNILSGYDPNIGLTAILVALVGVLAVSGALVAAVLFGGLTAASLYLPLAIGLPSTSLVFMTGLISMLVTARLGWGKWPQRVWHGGDRRSKALHDWGESKPLQTGNAGTKLEPITLDRPGSVGSRA